MRKAKARAGLAPSTLGRVELTKPAPRVSPRPSRLRSLTSSPPHTLVASLVPR